MKKILCSLILIFSSNLLAEDCTFNYDTKSAIISGTGFKFTNKTGVTATFSEFKLARKKSAASLDELIKKTKVSVDLQSIDSKNKERDHSLKTTLLANLKPVKIKVKDFKNDKIITKLKINNIAKDVVFDYELVDNRIIAKANIDFLNFNMKNNLNALIEKCKILHTGADGVSKTWTDFDLKLEVLINKTCK